MKRIVVAVPSGRPDALMAAGRAAELLRARGAEPLCEAEHAGQLPGCAPMGPGAAPDAVLAIGGDGTMLRGAQIALRQDVPLLGINKGSTGFLAEVEPEALEEAVDRLLRGDWTEEPRPVLEVTAEGRGQWFAMNDAVLTRGGFPRLIPVETHVDGKLAGRYRADGIVVATPTGSTGYSLSAGGPIVTPGVDCILLTPVCAHSLQNRPQVVAGSSCVTMTLVGGDREMRASLEVDGRQCLSLREGDAVRVRRSERRVRLIHLRELDFFSVVRDKLSEWTT